MSSRLCLHVYLCRKIWRRKIKNWQKNAWLTVFFYQKLIITLYVYNGHKIFIVDKLFWNFSFAIKRKFSLLQMGYGFSLVPNIFCLNCPFLGSIVSKEAPNLHVSHRSRGFSRFSQPWNMKMICGFYVKRLFHFST